MPEVARLFTYYPIEDDVINKLLTEISVGQVNLKFAEFEWSRHVMRDKFDKPLKVYLVRFKRRDATTN